MVTANQGIPEAEYDIHESLVHALLKSQHPDLADKPLRFFNHGWDNDLYRLGDDLLVRLPRRKLADTFLQNEIKYLPQISERLPLPVSVSLRNGKPESFYPAHWAITPWMPGERANECTPSSDSCIKWIEFLQCLHQTQPASGPHNPYRGVPLAKRDDAFKERFQRLQSKAKGLINYSAALSVWESGLKAKAEFEPVWLHGDLHPMNILCDNNQFVSVIDWGDICKGDAATDLASLWMLFDDETASYNIAKHYKANKDLILRSKASAVFFAVVLLETGWEQNASQEKCARQIFKNLGLAIAN